VSLGDPSGALKDAANTAARRILSQHPDCTIRIQCRLCSGSLSTVLELPSTPLANEYPEAPISGGQDVFPLYLARCNDCGHVQLPVVVNPERLFRDYAYQSGTSPVFREHLRKFAADVIPSKIGGFVVEIGSNDGTLLDEYRARGYKVLGVDPARNLVELCNRRGLDAIAEFFNPATARDILAKYGPADLIVANNVFAHSDDLTEIVQGVSMLLATRGSFVFEVGYWPDQVSKRTWSTVYHEHLSMHALRPLQSFLQKNALRMVDAMRVPTQHGSIRVSAVPLAPNDKTPWKVTPRCADMLIAEGTEATDAGVLSSAIAESRVHIRQKLDALKSAGKVVCGYGAPAQLTTTCYALGITAEDIAYICDDNPLKVGRYTPGRFIPIQPDYWLYEADACVIFSGNFAEDIMKRHADYKGEWCLL